MAAAPAAETAFAAVATALLPEPDVDEGTGFGPNPGLQTDGAIFAMLVRGGLVVKLPAERCSELIADGAGEAFEVGRRRMREWVRLFGVDQARWLELAQEARSYVAGSPRRARRPRKGEHGGG
jgi:hypothetical protein